MTIKTADNLSTLRQGQRYENISSGFPQLPDPCLFSLTAEEEMKRDYVVIPFNGRFLVFRELRNEEGYLMNRKITDNFDNYPEAEAKAKLGNYIVKKASEAFKELAGAK